MSELLPGSVPALRFADDERFIFGMACVPENGVLWKEALMLGEVDLQAATHAGTLLAQWHVRSAGQPDVMAQFADNNNFIQGRVDPYYRKAAEVNPDLAPLIEAEIERMLSVRQTLVHGDYSPKNIFVYPDHVMTIDLEVAHHGDPAFDSAFCLNHLLLKAVKFAPRHAEYLQAARAFWQAYDSQAGEAHFAGVEAHTLRALACLLLARIDGKSRVEYISDDPTRDFIRQFAAALLRSNETQIEPVINQLSQRLGANQE
jgi:5-methylthioribose kinase